MSLAAVSAEADMLKSEEDTGTSESGPKLTDTVGGGVQPSSSSVAYEGTQCDTVLR